MTAALGLLNVGCGDACHPQWTNVDYHPLAKGVIACDVRRGLAFPAARIRTPDSLFMEAIEATPGAAASGHH